jgi:hypothetical protein
MKVKLVIVQPSAGNLARTCRQNYLFERLEIRGIFVAGWAWAMGGNKDCAMIAAAPVLSVGYVVSASRIADRRMILAGYRLADLLTRVLTL